ncbi:IS5 family transposase [Salinisphaera hydrothermalis]|uniref:Transposase, IS4 n=1 Tax=Salinisphaera hydrothermalis (strain C41B8) TaxID=1304275 RepID=A0A084IMJ8_SALHC|nr:IS5 family transposase [Salinisphaera hydrothermalis]KEZ77932.1 transposase, IS4 [Salinisphaera hydrothermalis C41B8]
MARQMLSEKLWAKLRQILLAESIYDKPRLRQTVEGMLYRMRVGCPWRDLPQAFGPWTTIYQRFRAWAASGKWWRIFHACIVDPDLEWAFMDGSYAKAHQHSAGASGGQPQAIGPSRAGRTTKIHLAVDAYGFPITFEITGGQINDGSIGPRLVDAIPRVDIMIADKGYDSRQVRAAIQTRSSRPVIPRRRHSKRANPGFDSGLYRYRHLGENAFARLKQYRAIACRFDKLKAHYEAVVAMACALLWLPM